MIFCTEFRHTFALFFFYIFYIDKLKHFIQVLCFSIFKFAETLCPSCAVKVHIPSTKSTTLFPSPFRGESQGL